jgi:hypothetical protein
VAAFVLSVVCFSFFLCFVFHVLVSSLKVQHPTICVPIYLYMFMVLLLIAVLTVSGTSIASGSVLQFGAIADNNDWLCWKTGTTAPTITGAECATTGSATAFGSLGSVVCSSIAGAATKTIVWDDGTRLFLSVILCSGVGVASSNARAVALTLTEPGVRFVCLCE